MRVLITGATGFVGSHTTAALAAAGHDVKLFVRQPSRIGPALAPHGLTMADVEHAVGDVNDAASVTRALAGCDAVVHAGSAYAYGLPFWKWSALTRTNVQGTATLLRLAHEQGMDPIVYVSSSLALMQSAPGTVLTEDTPPGHPPEVYPRSKVRAEQIARAMQAAGAPVVITYPGGVWGPHDPHWGETSQLAEAILRGRMPFSMEGMTPFSDVREVAALHAAVLERGRGPRRYLVPSHNLTFDDVIGHVGRAAGRHIAAITLPSRAVLIGMLPVRVAQAISPFRWPLAYTQPWLISRRNTFAESRAQREFGIRPRPFEDSVRDTVRWMATTGRLPARHFDHRVIDRFRRPS